MAQVRHPGIADKTDADLQLYVNGTTGNDTTGTGYTVGSPLLTLQAAFDKIPDYCAHNVTVNIAGTLNEQGDSVLDKFVASGKVLLIDGGADLTSLAGPFAMDAAHTVDAIGNAGAGFVADAHIGRFVRIIDGAAIGQNRTIHTNTATTITPVKDLTNDPAVTDTFDVVRPATIFQATATPSTIFIRCRGNGTVVAQRFTMLGTNARISTQASETPVALAAFVNESTRTPSIDVFNATLALSATWLVPTTWVATATDVYLGTGQIGSTGQLYVSGGASCLGNVVGSVFKSVRLCNGASLGAFRYGTRVKGAVVLNGWNGKAGWITNGEMFLDDAGSGYGTTKVDTSAGVGITCEDSVLYLGGGVDLAAHTTWAILGIRSRIHHTGAVVSSVGSTVGGIYLRQGSMCTITSGAAPTYTNAANNLEISVNGSTEATDWATIDVPTPLVDILSEFVIVKEM